MGKPTICIGENKGADQLRSNCEADQRLCFRYMDSTIPLLSKSKISHLQPSSVLVQLGLCQTWSETTLFFHQVAHLVLSGGNILTLSPSSSSKSNSDWITLYSRRLSSASCSRFTALVRRTKHIDTTVTDMKLIMNLNFYTFSKMGKLRLSNC